MSVFRSKIEKFRVHMPILHTLCNPGLRERHWEMISKANGGGPISRSPETRFERYKCFNFDFNVYIRFSLADMIDAGLSKIVVQLEEIG